MERASGTVVSRPKLSASLQASEYPGPLRNVSGGADQTRVLAVEVCWGSGLHPEQEVARSSRAGPTPEIFPRLHFGVSGGFHLLEVPLDHRSHGEPAGGNLPLLLSNPSHQLRELAWVRERYFPSLRLTPNAGLDRPHFL